MHGFPEWFLPFVMSVYYGAYIVPVVVLGMIVWYIFKKIKNKNKMRG